jgi:molybdopterin-guanine dinucleotide biosynthesis protein MobB
LSTLIPDDIEQFNTVNYVFSLGQFRHHTLPYRNPETQWTTNIYMGQDVDSLIKGLIPKHVSRLIDKIYGVLMQSAKGKTTLLEKVIAELKLRGYRIGVIKHDAHRFDIDHPGKDSHRLTQAGADTMLVSSPEKLALIKQHSEPPPIEELIATYFGDVDLILTEGFKKSGLPKIEVHRRERSASLICRGEENDPSLIAVASDEPLELDVPVLDINNPAQVADFVEKHFIHAAD